MINLSSDAVRAKLDPRDAPYYDSLGRGQSIGLRKHRDGRQEWCARVFLTVDGKRAPKYETFRGVTTYDAAIAKATEWFRVISGGAVKKAGSVGSVATVLKKYTDSLRAHGTKPEGAIVRMENNHRNVIEEPIGQIDVEQLTAEDVAAWRTAMLRGERTRKDGREDRGMKLDKVAPATVNRYKKDFFAALNWATDIEFIVKNRGWHIRKNLKETIARPGEVIAKRQQLQILAKAPEGIVRDFFMCIMYSGARPVELTRTNREHLDLAASYGASIQLLSYKGKGAAARWRVCGIANEALAAFKRFAAGKLPKAKLFTDEHGDPINVPAMSRKFSAICAELAKETGEAFPFQLYDNRHTRITTLLKAKVDPQTVSHSTGTSLQMMDRHYSHLIKEDAVAKMAKAGL